MDSELVEARAVLLRGLSALGAQRQALNLIGAQAVYEHTKHLTVVRPTLTTDGDTSVIPWLVDPAFSIGEAMLAAGFTPHPDRPGIWGIDIDGRRIAFDILVPEALAGPGRRGARVPGQDKRYIGRAGGLELSVIDRQLRTLGSLDGSRASADVYVAGPAALICAKAYKIGERVGELERGGRDRVRTKDAGDVWRLMAVTDPVAVWEVFAAGEHESAIANAVTTGRRYVDDLFGENGRGLQLAALDLSDDMDERTVVDLAVSWMEGFQSER